MMMLALAADAAAEISTMPSILDLGGVLGTARLEQLGHARQTAGDVLGLGDLRGVLARSVPAAISCPSLDDDVRAGGEWIAGETVALVFSS
jgi:hypothetical protein